VAGSREDLLAAGFLSPGAGAASPDPELDELTRYVAYACNAPYAVLAVEARGKMWFKCRVGVDAAEAALTELAPGVEVIEDSSRDPRASLHPLLAAVPDARFLAAAPLQDGPARFGTLAVLDRRPRSPAPHQLEALRVAAAQASALLQLRRRVRLLEALIESSPDQFYAFDPRGRCLFASERGASTMGLVPAQMVGRTWQEVGWDSGYAAQFQGMLRLALDTGQLIEDARAVPTPAGVVHTEYALGPLRGPRG
jgi:PAS domain S-box-containing protein